MAKSQSLVARLLNLPDLPAVVPRLQPEVLHRVIQSCGLEDCSEIVAYASAAQLAHVFDLDLWRARTPGAAERFDADRFGVWLDVLMAAGPDVAADKLAGLDIDLVAAGFAQHVSVSDGAAVAAYTTLDGERMPGRPSNKSHATDVGGYAIEARRTEAWEATVELLRFLAAERSEFFHALMRVCVSLSGGAIEEDLSHGLLDRAEQHVFDLAAEREARRERQGYVTSEQAHAFLRSARGLNLDGDRPEPSVLARAYFREFDASVAEGHQSASAPPNEPPVDGVLQVLHEAGVIASAPRALLPAGDSPASDRQWIESHLSSHTESLVELAYLANVVAAGCSVQGRPLDEKQTGDMVVATCNLGLENWPAHWPNRDLVTAFRVGSTILHRDVCIFVTTSLIAILGDLRCTHTEISVSIEGLRRALARHVHDGEPWRVRERLDALMILDAAAWAAVRSLIDEWPVIHAALRGLLERGRRTIDPSAFEFIAGNDHIAAVRRFMAELRPVLEG